jgi:hypothetical protein
MNAQAGFFGNHTLLCLEHLELLAQRFNLGRRR